MWCGQGHLLRDLTALLPLRQVRCLRSLPLARMFQALPLPLCDCQWFLLIHENAAAALPRAQGWSRTLGRGSLYSM